jgi:hypothetical protein
MGSRIAKLFCIGLISFALSSGGGCLRDDQARQSSKPLVRPTDLGKTIGTLAEVQVPQALSVEGYGLVGNLPGTGSSECPSAIRAYLTRYIATRLPQHAIDVGKLIDSRDTAVVYIQGRVPSLASKSQKFDLKITALRGTQTSSLEGGWLYASELKPTGMFSMGTRAVAEAVGPVYIDTLDAQSADLRTGYILGGGSILDDYRITVALRDRDFTTTSNVRNRINERFGEGVATAIVPGRVEVTVPVQYSGDKDRFVAMLKALYLDQSAELNEERIKTFVRRLAVEPDKDPSEIALEGIGYESVAKLRVLLSSSSQQVQFHAARCLLNLNDDQGLQILRGFALGANSAYRVESLQALANSARRDDAAPVARRLLRDSNFEVRLAAYEHLRRLEDVAVTRERIGRSFYLEQIAQAGEPTVYVARSDSPRVVLFGAPMYCRDAVFIQSADGSTTMNAPRGQGYVSLARKHPTKPAEVLRLNSSFKLSDIIRVLGDDVSKTDDRRQGGLGVPYDQIVTLLSQMCQRGAIDAEFKAGPTPKID